MPRTRSSRPLRNARLVSMAALAIGVGMLAYAGAANAADALFVIGFAIAACACISWIVLGIWASAITAFAQGLGWDEHRFGALGPDEQRDRRNAIKQRLWKNVGGTLGFLVGWLSLVVLFESTLGARVPRWLLAATLGAFVGGMGYAWHAFRYIIRNRRVGRVYGIFEFKSDVVQETAEPVWRPIRVDQRQRAGTTRGRP